MYMIAILSWVENSPYKYAVIRQNGTNGIEYVCKYMNKEDAEKLISELV